MSCVIKHLLPRAVVEDLGDVLVEGVHVAHLLVVPLGQLEVLAVEGDVQGFFLGLKLAVIFGGG